jgi:hypothetical protein
MISSCSGLPLSVVVPWAGERVNAVKTTETLCQELADFGVFFGPGRLAAIVM